MSLLGSYSRQGKITRCRDCMSPYLLSMVDKSIPRDRKSSMIMQDQKTMGDRRVKFLNWLCVQTAVQNFGNPSIGDYKVTHFDISGNTIIVRDT